MKAWLLSLVPLLLVGPAQSQSSSTGVLTGVAYDLQHHPISAARITLQSNGLAKFVFKTNEKGIYRAVVPAGTYALHVLSEAGDEAITPAVSVPAATVTTVDLILKPSSALPDFSDEPNFIVAGVTDNTYRGGHGSDSVLRSAEALAKATASLGPSASQQAGADPHHTQAEIAERSGHPLEAAKEFQKAAELTPTEGNLFDWGSELLAHRTLAPAAEVFARGTRLFPQSVRMKLGLATAWYAAGEYQQAAGTFFQACDLDPHNPDPYLFLTRIKSREITELPPYQERLKRFAKLQPGNSLASYAYAVSVWNNRQGPEDMHAVAEAVRLLNSTLTIDAQLAPAHLQLGIIKGAQGEYGEAMREYRRAIELDPDLEEAHYRLSEAYRVQGDRASATNELTLYNRLAKKSAERMERERSQIVQFVVALRNK